MTDAPETDRIFYEKPVAIYARLSKNPDGTLDSVPTQLASARRRCAKEWPGRPVIEFFDDDKRASDENVYRPGYEALCAAIKAGEVGDVYTRFQSRLTRLPGPWSKFRKLCTKAGITELHTARGKVGLAPGKAMLGKVQNLFDEEFTEMVKLGVMDTLDERAEQGRPHGGKTYGYRHVRELSDGRIITDAGRAGVPNLVVVPDEAAVVLHVAERVLAGWSLAAIARELTEAETYRRAGTPWTTSGLRRIVTNPVVAGLHTRHGVETGVAGTWPGILDVATFSAIRATLNQPREIVDSDGRKRVITGTRVPARNYELTSIARCGLCRHRLIAQRRVVKDGPSFHYICSSARGGCGHLSTVGPPLEAYVAERYLEWVASDRFLDFLAAGDTDADARRALKVEREALRQRRRDIGERAATGRMSLDAAEAAEVALGQQETELLRREAHLVPLSPTVRDPQAILVGWEFMPLDERRACYFDAQASVLVQPANGRRGFHPDRAVVSFGGQAPAATARSSARRKRKPVAVKTSEG